MASNLRPEPFLLVIVAFFLLSAFAIVKFSYPQSDRNLDKRSGRIVWLVESGSQSLFSVFHRFVFFKFYLDSQELVADETEVIDEEIVMPLVVADETEIIDEEIVMPTELNESPVIDEVKIAEEPIDLQKNNCWQEGLGFRSGFNLDEHSQEGKFNWKNWNIVSILTINWRCLWQDYWQRQSSWLNTH